MVDRPPNPTLRPPEVERPRVAILTPSLEGPFPQYRNSLERSLSALESAGWQCFPILEIGDVYISRARTRLIRQALDARSDVMIFIDYDVSWEPQDLLRLITTPGQVVAGIPLCSRGCAGAETCPCGHHEKQR